MVELRKNLENDLQIRTQELEYRNNEIRKQSKLLQALSNRMMEAQDIERRRIARELHDSVGQLLAALNMALTPILQRIDTSAPELHEKSEDCREIYNEILQEIRTVTYLLHPPLLEEAGLSAAVSWYIRGLQERCGLSITMNFPERNRRLPYALELVVFRIIQECLTNIHRHSGSQTASIRLSVNGPIAMLEIKDQGKGIPPDKLAEIKSHGSGVGIQGIRERLRPYKGNLEIESSPKGTTVTATFLNNVGKRKKQRMDSFVPAGKNL